jgi:hypothetical protein
MNLNKIILTLTSIILSFGFLEIGLRLYTKVDTSNYELEMMRYANELKELKIYKNQQYLKHKPNKKIKIMNVEINTDKWGFRESKIESDINLPKIILLGDSMTFGFGSKITFSDILQEKFIKKYKFLNTAVGNTNTIMQVSYFFSEMQKFDKKIIILNFYINDLENINLGKKNFLNSNFYIYNFINFRINLTNSKKKNYIEYYKNTFLDEEVKKKTFDKILELKKYSEKNNIIFIVNIIPDLREIMNYPFDKEENIIKNFLSKNNIFFIEHINNFRGYNPKDLWVSNTDPHPNEKAHRILSLNLGEYIEKK